MPSGLFFFERYTNIEKSKKMTIDRRLPDSWFFLVKFNSNWVDLRDIPMHQLKHYLDNSRINLTEALLISDTSKIEYLKQKVRAIEGLYQRRLKSE